jgi:phosphoadenosine phosphosulfate reductase
MRSLAMHADESSAAIETPSVRETIIALLRDEDASTLEARAKQLEDYSALEIIEGAISAYGKDAAVSTAFGPGGLCVMHMAKQFDPEVRAFYIDTGFVFPETEHLLKRWVGEQKLNLKRVLPVLSIEEQAKEHGDRLWMRDPDQCCAIRKVEPNNRALDGVKLWIAALRRDEAKTRTETPVLQRIRLPNGQGLLKLCPIVKWSQKEVWRYISDHALPYNELHDRGYPSIGCTHCTRPVKPGEDERAGRWSGTQKTECGLHTAYKA